MSASAEERLRRERASLERPRSAKNQEVSHPCPHVRACAPYYAVCTHEGGWRGRALFSSLLPVALLLSPSLPPSLFPPLPLSLLAA
eukprot:783056-Rhodomonas_salina.1